VGTITHNRRGHCHVPILETLDGPDFNEPLHRLLEASAHAHSRRLHHNDRLDEYLEEVISDYRDFFDVLTTQLPELKTFCHGYDWMRHLSLVDHARTEDSRAAAVPDHQGRGRSVRLEQLAGDAKYQGNVIYVYCRNTVGNKAKWFDEIHPRDPGFGRVAGKFKTAIDKALKGVA
jgi:hypothetical protein